MRYRVSVAALAAALALPQAAAANTPSPSAAPPASTTQPATPAAAAPGPQPAANQPAEASQPPAQPAAADASPQQATTQTGTQTATAPVPAPVPPHDCPSCVAHPPRPDLPKDNGTGLIVGGACTLGTVYLLSSLSGAAMIDKAAEQERADNPLTVEDESRDTDSKRLAGRALLIPVAGPFMALRHVDEAKGKWGLALNGALQIAGSALIVAGLVRRAKYKQARRWGLVAGASPRGGSVGMKMRF